MAKKKTVKKKTAAPKKTAVKKVAAPLKVSFEDVVLNTLNNLIEIAKAQLFDALKTYIEGKIRVSLPATLDDFMYMVAKTLEVFGITDKDLLESLSPEHVEYLKHSASVLEAGPKGQTITLVKKGSAVTTEKPSGTHVQNGQADKGSSAINPNDFGLGDLAVASESPKGSTVASGGVFDSLDILK